MDNHPAPSLSDQLAAAQDWWREAGVDCLFLDEAQRMLPDDESASELPVLEPVPERAPRTDPPPPVEPAIAVGDLPATLAEFRQWWLEPQMPLPAAGPRVAPVGEPGAELMLLVPMPEQGDSESLLQGPQGHLLGNIARALGFGREQLYLASALPAHMAMPDWPHLGQLGLGAVVRHHVALAKPRKVLLFGSAIAQLLDPDTLEIPALATRAPEHLLAHPRQRAKLWQRLLEWTARP